jgi:hypothetical protein
MACDSPRIWLWARVPDGSHVEVCVEAGEGSTADDFEAVALFDIDEGQDEWWDHATLVSCTHEAELVEPRRYAVGVSVMFASNEPRSALIRGQVRKPDGSIHGTPYCREVVGTRDQIERCHLVINTLQDGA